MCRKDREKMKEDRKRKKKTLETLVTKKKSQGDKFNDIKKGDQR